MKTKLLASVLSTTLFIAACAPMQNQTGTPAASAAQMQSRAERNKANVLDFYEMAFNRHKLQEAVDKHIGAEYLQHNPGVKDGGQAFIDAFTPFLKENPQSSGEIKRVVAEGDLVMVHVHSKTNADDRGEAVVDIFRLDENGKIVEHWDVIQPVPEKTASGRSMF